MISITSIVTFLVGFNVIAAISWDAFFVEPGRTLFPLDFRLRRIENWLPMGIVYCGFYTARYNMAAANVPSLIEESRMVDSSIPLALSLGFWSYAVTAPWTGMYADRVGGRQAILLATFGSTLCNLVAAALAWIPSWTGATRTVLILFFYTINVVFQGFGTSAVVKINAMWYSAKERGSFSGVFNVLVTSGYFTSLSTGSWVAKRFGFPALFLLPSVLLTTGGVFILTWVQNRPETTWAGMSGFKSLPKSKLDDETDPLVEMKGEGARSYDSINHGNDRDDDTKHCNDSANDDKLSSFQKLSSDAVFLCYCGAVFFLSFVRDGLLSWIFSFLEYRRKEELSIDLTSMLGAGITIGGFLGGVTCGVMSDLIFKGSRIQPILVFTTGQVAALLILWFYGGLSSGILDTLSLFLSCFFVCGNYSLLNYTIPSDLDPEVIGTAVGLLTMTGYIASGLGGITMHMLIESGGFQAWTFSMILSSAMAACTIILGGIISVRRDQAAPIPKLSPRKENMKEALRTSTTSDVDIFSGLLSASIQEDW